MKIFKYIPFFLYLLIIYNILAFSGAGAQQVLNAKLFDMNLISGANFILDISDLLIILGVIALYIEILKSTRTSSASVIDHGLSMVVFIIFLIEFIVIKNAGNSTFLILTLMAMLDVIAGFTVTISTARRDISFMQ